MKRKLAKGVGRKRWGIRKKVKKRPGAEMGCQRRTRAEKRRLDQKKGGWGGDQTGLQKLTNRIRANKRSIRAKSGKTPSRKCRARKHNALT